MTNGERRRIGVLLVRNSGSHCMCAISANDHTSEQSVQGFVRRLRDTPCSGVKLLGFVDVDKGEITNAEGTEDLGLAESVLARKALEAFRERFGTVGSLSREQEFFGYAVRCCTAKK